MANEFVWLRENSMNLYGELLHDELLHDKWNVCRAVLCRARTEDSMLL